MTLGDDSALQTSQVLIIHLLFPLEERELLLGARHFDNDRSGRLASVWTPCRGAKDTLSERLAATNREMRRGIGSVDSVSGIPGPHYDYETLAAKQWSRSIALPQARIALFLCFLCIPVTGDILDVKQEYWSNDGSQTVDWRY